MSDPVQVRIARPAPDVVVLAVFGEIDIVTAPDLDAAVARALAAPVRHLVVDLSGVTFFGSLGLATLIRTADARRAARACGSPSWPVGSRCGPWS